jgi:alpha-mannosidase II
LAIRIDRDESTRIFTHILPFYGYDIPYTCGPDPKICCQFDFKRGTDPHTTCLWGINPTPITDENIQERWINFIIKIIPSFLYLRAQLLLDQYRKKSQLYRTNILFIPLGDDFRYRTIHEANLQLENYDKLLTYLNQRTDWHVDVRFFL